MKNYLIIVLAVVVLQSCKSIENLVEENQDIKLNSVERRLIHTFNKDTTVLSILTILLRK